MKFSYLHDVWFCTIMFTKQKQNKGIYNMNNMLIIYDILILCDYLFYSWRSMMHQLLLSTLLYIMILMDILNICHFTFDRSGFYLVCFLQLSHAFHLFSSFVSVNFCFLKVFHYNWYPCIKLQQTILSLSVWWSECEHARIHRSDDLRSWLIVWDTFGPQSQASGVRPATVWRAE